ncbi:hypothetical protein NC651_040441 [Populus alba x Populus x berolinensis]|nr:hypothetical protein NC651_040441 [Populus alba x Populus x berolinensis]
MWQLDVPPNQIVALEGNLFSSGDCLNAWKGHIEAYDGKLNIWNVVDGSRLQTLSSPMHLHAGRRWGKPATAQTALYYRGTNENSFVLLGRLPDACQVRIRDQYRSCTCSTHQQMKTGGGALNPWKKRETRSFVAIAVLLDRPHKVIPARSIIMVRLGKRS